MLRLRNAQERSETGYTMIEVALVIAIVAIVSVLTIPNLAIWIARMRLKNAEVKLERTISMVKKMSVTNRMRYCMEFTPDATHTDGNADSWLIGVDILQETDVDSGVWVEVTSPVELASWDNSVSNELFKSITLESDPLTTTAFNTVDGCTGLLFNNFGYLTDADPSHFITPCGGNNCAILTLRNKAQTFTEQRTLWIDQGGNVRISQNPSTLPIGGGAS